MALDDDDVGTIDRRMWQWAGFAVLFGMILAACLFWFFNRAAAQTPEPQRTIDEVAIVRVTVEIRPKQTATATRKAVATAEPTALPSPTATAQPTKIPVTIAPTQAVRTQIEPMILPTVTPTAPAAAKVQSLRVASSEVAKFDTLLVYSEADMQDVIDAIAADMDVELGNNRGVRLLAGKVTVFADVIGEIRTKRHEMVFQVSAENGQVRVTLERAVIDGYPLTDAKEMLLLQRIATAIEHELDDRYDGRTLEAITIGDMEVIVTLR